MMDIETIRTIGLTDGEAKVYLALMKLGSSTTGPIADKSGVARSKIYHVLERLVQKGLVSYIIQEKTRYYQAEDPSKLREYIQQKEESLKTQKETVEKLIPQLQVQKLLGKQAAEAHIYKGFKGITTVHEHMYTRLKRGEGFYYMGIPSYQDKKYHLYWQRDHKLREKAKLYSRGLFNQGTPRDVLENRNNYKYIDCRYMPLPLETPAWFMGYNDITVIGLQGEEDMAIEIINKKIADSFRAYFEALWKMSKPFT